MSRGPRGLVVLAAIVLISASQADGPENGKPEDAVAAGRRAMDTVLFHTLRDVINRGVDLYNEGNSAGCYRVFEGALMTVRPLLKHRPEVQKMIAQQLASAERDPVA